MTLAKEITITIIHLFVLMLYIPVNIFQSCQGLPQLKEYHVPVQQSRSEEILVTALVLSLWSQEILLVMSSCNLQETGKNGVY